MSRSFILFVDFDGVMHPLGTAGWDGAVFSAPGAFVWWPALEAMLARVEQEHGLCIELVVHSTWRLMWETDDELHQVLPDSLVRRLRDCTPRDVVARQASIEAYCVQQGIERFAVLDDEPQAFSTSWRPLLPCDPARGAADPAVLARLEALLRG